MMDHLNFVVQLGFVEFKVFSLKIRRKLLLASARHFHLLSKRQQKEGSNGLSFLIYRCLENRFNIFAELNLNYKTENRSKFKMGSYDITK